MFVFSNLATSLDGKISTRKRELALPGSAEDRANLQRLRREADAILMGASTLRCFRKPLIVSGAETQPMNVVVSSKLEGIQPTWPFFKDSRTRRVLFVSPQAPKARIRRFEKVAEVVVLKRPTSRLPAALQMIRALDRLGARRLLIEGGGSVMWDFVSQNLIDEYHLTLTARMIGGTESPTLVDGEGFAPKDVLSLRLTQCRVVGDELFLIYRKPIHRK
jgi:riboflavin-specific deaminase-like protein